MCNHVNNQLETSYENKVMINFYHQLFNYQIFQKCLLFIRVMENYFLIKNKFCSTFLFYCVVEMSTDTLKLVLTRTFVKFVFKLSAEVGKESIRERKKKKKKLFLTCNDARLKFYLNVCLCMCWFIVCL